MSVFRRNKRRGSEPKSPEAISAQSESSTEPATVDNSGGVTRRRDGSDKKKTKKHSEILPDKALEESVIELNFMYVAKNLPPDDVAPTMFNRCLLTDKEYEKYRSLRDTPKPDYEKSEYLLGCLLRRKAGFLREFCGILRNIEPASHIADHLELAYKEQAAKEGFSRHRLSKMSHSDHDIRKRKVSSNSKQRCSHCTSLEMLNEKLKRSCDELWSKDTERELQHMQQLKGQVECLVRSSQQQLEQLEEENKELRALLGKAKEDMLQLQDTLTAIERRIYTQTGANLSTNIRLLDHLSRAWQVHVQPSNVDQSAQSKAAVIHNPQRMHELEVLHNLSDGSETTDELTRTASEMSLVPSSEAEQDRPLEIAMIQTNDSKTGIATYTAASFPLQSSYKYIKDKTGNGATQSLEMGDTGQDSTPDMTQPKNLEVQIQESNPRKRLDRHNSVQDTHRESFQLKPTTFSLHSSADNTFAPFSYQVDGLHFGEKDSLISPKAKQPLHESESLAATCMVTPELEQKLQRRRKRMEQQV